MNNQEIAKYVFARHPKIDAVHITSDGQAFTEMHQADAHAQRLKDKKVKTLTKDDSVKVPDHVAHNGVDLDKEALEKAEIESRFAYARELDIDVDGIEEVAIVNELIAERQNQELEVVGDKNSTATEVKGATDKADPEKVEQVIGEAAKVKAAADEVADASEDSATEAEEGDESSKLGITGLQGNLLQQNVGEVGKSLEGINTAEELDAFAKAEKEGGDRKGVHTAIEARRKALTEKSE